MHPRRPSIPPAIRRLTGVLPGPASWMQLRAAFRETAGLVLLATSTVGYLWLLERVSIALSTS